jgi:hypothetical protein
MVGHESLHLNTRRKLMDDRELTAELTIGQNAVQEMITTYRYQKVHYC